MEGESRCQRQSEGFATIGVHGLWKADVQAAEADFKAVFPGQYIFDLTPDLEFLMVGDFDAQFDFIAELQWDLEGIGCGVGGVGGGEGRLRIPAYEFRLIFEKDAEGNGGEVPEFYVLPFLLSGEADGKGDEAQFSLGDAVLAAVFEEAGEFCISSIQFCIFD